MYWVRAWKTQLWDKAIDPWLSLFSDIGIELLLARINDKGVGDEMKSRLSLLGAGAVVLAKSQKGTSSYCLTALALICSIPLFPYRSFISAY